MKSEFGCMQSYLCFSKEKNIREQDKESKIDMERLEIKEVMVIE